MILCKTESINTNGVIMNDLSRCFLSHLLPSLLIQKLPSSAQHVDGLFESAGANDVLQVFQHAFVMLRLAFGLHHCNLFHFSLMKISSHTHLRLVHPPLYPSLEHTSDQKWTTCYKEVIICLFKYAKIIVTNLNPSNLKYTKS